MPSIRKVTIPKSYEMLRSRLAKIGSAAHGGRFSISFAQYLGHAQEEGLDNSQAELALKQFVTW